MATGIINNSIVPSYRYQISMNNIKKAGVYYCDQCTNGPSNLPWTVLMLEVVSVSDTTVKQLARPMATEGFCFERHLMSGTWSPWRDVGRFIPLQGDTSTTIYVRKPGDYNYGSFIITGTAAGLGGVLIGVIINNHAISSIKDLMTGTAWTNTNLTITYGLDGNVGYIGIKTTSSLGSNLCIVGG